MTAQTNLHRATMARADSAQTIDGRDVSWLEISDGKGNSVSVFMPLGQAAAMAKAWADASQDAAPST